MRRLEDTIRKNDHTFYKCRNCGNPTSSRNSLCRTCYLKNSGLNKPKCKICGKPIQRHGRLCSSCYTKALRTRAEKKQAEANKRKEANIKRITEKLKSTDTAACPKATDGKHYEIIDSDNIGKCQHCGRIKDYNVLQKSFMLNL